MTSLTAQSSPARSAAAATAASTDAGLESLAQLLKRYRSDKFWRHHYEHYYEKWFGPLRHVAGLRMAEIGAERGRSLDVWKEYFDNAALIVGLAYGSGTVESSEAGRFGKDERVKVVNGDQSDPAVLAQLCELGPFDVIIDDGSHVPSHMVISFAHLFGKCIKEGGIYVIEDLETSYWNKRQPDGELPKVYNYELNGGGIGQPPPENAVEKFKQMIDVLMRKQLGYEGLSILPGDDQICSIEFGMNLMAFHKCTQEQRKRPPELGVYGPGGAVDEGHMKEYLNQARVTNPVGI
eukprot:CAMPEP_0183308610 /NCGR_PEP_ID=MMETSP0160_2-20130417/22356_1 /TAXON_ID=2839 ORGANISM="Odontella Sinensis, Strain Grunow 1884" /NCGR_SAMPLE_ID=MMETSP0160_2 /ASSEMBLY_ACC=CAM_ASM_000250 /LENGTH=292 /DNA_ID=CAMNT_0025472471 /DNA_START=159 /DNA_END=1037 /DNA_ORIENTATION=+